MKLLRIESRRETVGNDGDVGRKKSRKISKYYIVAEKQCGDDGLGKRESWIRLVRSIRVEHNNNCDKSVVGEETSCGDKFGDEGWIHVRVSLWSLHRLIPNLSPQQKKNIIDMGFRDVLDFKIKDVPTRLSYWLLDNFNEETCVLNVNDFRHRLVVEWKSQFGKMERYYHGPLEQLIYTQTDGGWWFKINFLVLYLTSIGEANKNATCNLRFLYCINDETTIHQFDWCTFILECLVRTKKNWVRRSHYTGPIIILVTIKENVGLPLVNNWTVDMLNKLEDERFSMMNVEEVKKSVVAKFKKASELIDESEYDVDDALEQNPHEKELIQLRDLRDVLFVSRKYSQPASDNLKRMRNKLMRVRSIADVPGNADNIVAKTSALTPYNICDAQLLQSIPPQAMPRRTQRNVQPSEVLRSPYVVREVYLCGTVSNHEKRSSDCLFSGRLMEMDILFKTDSVNGLRGVLETLCPGILISSGVIDIFTKVLNHTELYRDLLKSMRRVLFKTSMMEVHIRDNISSLVTDVSARYGDVVEYLVVRFIDFLAYQNHPTQGVMRNVALKILSLGCMTKKNFIDCGVFALCHIETYMGGEEYDDLCELRRECKAQKLQLDEPRLKYVVKILLVEFNQKKSYFEVEVEAYRQLPLEERQRSEEAAFEIVKAHVTLML
nr:peptidase C48, SUMO/sentrin/Ubl1 [Tanacetum cinerariifolium]